MEKLRDLGGNISRPTSASGDVRLLRRRIEYGFECACPDTTIYLPPDFDDEPLEQLLQPLLRQDCRHRAKAGIP
jgi:hypothetical protein